MGVGAGLYMYDVVVKVFTFAISSTDEFLSTIVCNIRYFTNSLYPTAACVELSCAHLFTLTAYELSGRTCVMKMGNAFKIVKKDF